MKSVRPQLVVKRDYLKDKERGDLYTRAQYEIKYSVLWSLGSSYNALCILLGPKTWYRCQILIQVLAKLHYFIVTRNHLLKFLDYGIFRNNKYQVQNSFLSYNFLDHYDFLFLICAESLEKKRKKL